VHQAPGIPRALFHWVSLTCTTRAQSRRGNVEVYLVGWMMAGCRLVGGRYFRKRVNADVGGQQSRGLWNFALQKQSAFVNQTLTAPRQTRGTSRVLQQTGAPPF
jgi:hypothetical protein